MADEGVHDVRELNRQLIRGWARGVLQTWVYVDPSYGMSPLLGHTTRSV